MTIATWESPCPQALANKGLIDDELWNRLVGRIVFEEAIERSFAERILDQTLAFLKLCAENPTQSYDPSPLVGIGWRTFILYTRAYAEFCVKLGVFIHHEPHDLHGIDFGDGGTLSTANALKENNFVVDDVLWENSAFMR